MLDRCRGGLVIERTVWAFGVVFLVVLAAKYPCFEQMTEDFSAEEFVLESAVEVLDSAVFPRSVS